MLFTPSRTLCHLLAAAAPLLVSADYFTDAQRDHFVGLYSNNARFNHWLNQDELHVACGALTGDYAHDGENLFVPPPECTNTDWKERTDPTCGHLYGKALPLTLLHQGKCMVSNTLGTKDINLFCSVEDCSCGGEGPSQPFNVGYVHLRY